MHDVHEFLRTLTIVLAVAAITTVVFQKLRQPVVLGYIIAGLIVGPHVPIPLVADGPTVRTLSELGVIMLMFALGLEFSPRKMVRVAPTAGVTALIQSGLMAWLGFLLGRLLGWTTLESLFAGAAVAVSSTTIIAKVFDEQHVGGRLRDLVVGVLLIEDLLAVIFMAVLTAVAGGAGLSAGALTATAGRLAGFLALMLVVGILVVPRLVRLVHRIGRPETTLVASIGLCFFTSYMALEAGYSVALGAFLAGSLVAESGHGEEIEHLVRPVRDMFAAIFFVSVGLLIDPGLALAHWPAIAAFTVLVIGGKVVGVSVGAFLTGAGSRTSIQAGMSMAQIGEFSFIIASLGITLGVTRDFLYPILVAVSAVTTLTTPWLVRVSGRSAEFVDRKLPHRFQTLAALYAAWLERLRAPSAAPRASGGKRIAKLLAVDVALIAGVIWLSATQWDRATLALTDQFGLPEPLAHLALAAGAGSLLLPLVLGVGRLAQRLGGLLSETALPKSGAVDLDAAPRRALVLTLQLAVVLVSALAVIAVTQPVLPSWAGVSVLILLTGAFGVELWRRTRDLEGHVRAGSQAVMESLRKRLAPGTPMHGTPLVDIQALLPGLGATTAIEVTPASHAAGRSLAELNLRGRTGATVLAIARGTGTMVVPAAGERLQPGDVLAVTGSEDAIAAAQAFVSATTPPAETA